MASPCYLCVLLSLHYHATSLSRVRSNRWVHAHGCSVSLPPSLSLHHPNALWQCRLLCSLLNGKPEIIPKLEISLPLSLCHIHPFFLFFIFSLLLRAVARVFASTNVSTPNMHVFCQQNSFDWDPVDSAHADKTGTVMLNSCTWVY